MKSELFFNKQTAVRCVSASRAPRLAFSGGPPTPGLCREPGPWAFNHSDSDIPSPSPSEWPILGGTEIFMSSTFAHTPMRLPSLWYTAHWTQRWSLPVHLLLIFGPSPDPWKCSCELYKTSLMQAADTTHRRLLIMLICYSWSTWPHILQAFNSGTDPLLFKRIFRLLWESATVSGQMLGLGQTRSDSLTRPTKLDTKRWKMDASKLQSVGASASVYHLVNYIIKYYLYCINNLYYLFNL